MEYSKDKAKELASKYNLSPETPRMWKKRGFIPDQYADEEYNPRKILPSLSDSERVLAERVCLIFENRGLNQATFAKLCGFPRGFLPNLRAGRTSVNSGELKKIIAELVRVKNDIKSAFRGGYSEDKVKRIFSDKRIRPKIITRGFISPNRLGHFRSGMCKKINYFTDDEEKAIQDAFFRVVLMITV